MRCRRKRLRNRLRFKCRLNYSMGVKREGAEASYIDAMHLGIRRSHKKKSGIFDTRLILSFLSTLSGIADDSIGS